MSEKISPLQAMVDGMSAQWQRERAESQMTLGKFIELLAAMPADFLIDGLGEPDSYRGYYSDLAFGREPEKVTAGALLAMCRAAMGQVYQGYKGGDYMMGANTPLWVAHYGSCGEKLMGINPDGSLITQQNEY